LVQERHDAGQQGTIALVGKICLDVANNAVAIVHSHATEVIESSRFAKLDQNTDLRVGGPVMSFVAQQPRLETTAP
jgi:hypothetical protein